MKYNIITLSLLALQLILQPLIANTLDKEQVMGRAVILRDAFEDCKVTGYTGLSMYYGDGTVQKIHPDDPDFSRVITLTYRLAKAFETGNAPIDYERAVRLYNAEIRHARYNCNGDIVSSKK